MDPTLSISILHYPVDDYRRALLAGLLLKLQPEARRLNVLVEVAKDTHGRGLWYNARQAWVKASSRSNTHHMMLSDDVLPCRNFLAGLLKAIAVKPEVPISPYANRSIITEARKRGDSWAIIPGGVWGQGFVLPVARIPEFLTWERASFSPAAEFKHYDDVRVAAWSTQIGLYPWATVPSLIEHIAPSDSTIGFSNSKRVARWFIGERGDALSIDWSKGSQNPLKAAGASTSGGVSYLLPKGKPC